MEDEKSVSFGYDEVLTHAGLHEDHGVEMGSPVFAAEKDDPDLVCTVWAAKLDKSQPNTQIVGG